MKIPFVQRLSRFCPRRGGTPPPGCFADPRDGLGNTTPYVVYEFE